MSTGATRLRKKSRRKICPRTTWKKQIAPQFSLPPRQSLSNSPATRKQVSGHARQTSLPSTEFSALSSGCPIITPYQAYQIAQFFDSPRGTRHRHLRSDPSRLRAMQTRPGLCPFRRSKGRNGPHASGQSFNEFSWCSRRRNSLHGKNARPSHVNSGFIRILCNVQASSARAGQND